MTLLRCVVALALVGTGSLARAEVGEKVTGYLVYTSRDAKLTLPGWIGPEKGTIRFFQDKKQAVEALGGMWPLKDGDFKHLVKATLPTAVVSQLRPGKGIVMPALVPFGSANVEKGTLYVTSAALAQGNVRVKTAKVPQLGKSTNVQFTWREPVQRTAVKAQWAAAKYGKPPIK